MANTAELQHIAENQQFDAGASATQHQAGDALRTESFQDQIAASRALTQQILLHGNLDLEAEADRVTKLIEQPSRPHMIFQGMAELSGDLEALYGGGDVNGYNHLLQDVAHATAHGEYQLKLNDMDPNTSTYDSVELRMEPSSESSQYPNPPLFTIAQPGDSLWRIAEEHPIGDLAKTHDYMETLARVNGVEQASQIKVGQAIFMADAG